MNLPGFTADLSLGESKGNVYRMVAAFHTMSGTVQAAQLDGDITALGTCAATTECGPCERICIPRFGCFGFQVCCCTTKGGNRKCTARRC